MLSDLIAFEWRYHTRQVSFPAAAALQFLFGFATTATAFGPPNIHLDSPYSVMQSIGLLSLVSIFVLAVFCANAIVRDGETRMEEIVFSTAVTKFHFLFSRFFGSFLAAFTAFSASALGMFAARFLPSHDPARLGTMDLVPYLWALLVMALPNLFVAAAIVFSIASLTRSVLASYVAAVFIYVLYFVVSAMTNSPLMAASVPGADAGVPYVALFDPFGLSAFFEQTRYWTAEVRNARLLSLTGNFLLNRAMWIAIAIGCWAVVYRLFAFRIASARKVGLASGRTSRRRPAGGAGQRPAERPPGGRPHMEGAPHVSAPRFLPAYLATTRLELRSLIANLPFLALMLLWGGLAASEILSTVDSGEYGSRLYPTTSIVLSAIQMPLAILASIVLVYFSAEIVWRERTVRMDGVLNATPSPSLAFVLSKWTALCALVFILIATGTFVAVLIQMAKGYTSLEPSVILGFAYFAGAPLVVFAMAAVLVHTLSPHKYLGMLIVLLLAVIQHRAELFGLQHPLWKFAAAPVGTHSDMNGFGLFATPFHWLMLHWTLVGTLCLAIASAYWRHTRVRRLPAWPLVLAILFSGVHLYANVDATDTLQWRAEYEQQYARYASLPQPRITDLKAGIEIYPGERRYRVRGRYRLTNATSSKIERVLVAVRREASNVRLSMPGATPVEQDAKFAQRWFLVHLPPGATTELAFDLTFASPGVVDLDADESVAGNGSFLLSHRFLPTLGYRASYELTDRNERRKRGLPPEQQARAPYEEWFGLDLTLSTSADQIAITTGRLLREWTSNGRRFSHYKTDKPVPNGFAVASARYTVARAKHGDVDVALYSHPAHRQNVQRMLRAATVSLATFEQTFGPYPHRQLKIVELPAHWNVFGGLARPDMVFLPETRAILIDAEDSERLDVVTRRTAHEVAHQWWGLHVTPRQGPGAIVIAESLTKYAELLVVEKLYGAEHVRQSLQYERDLYLTGRTQANTELPLVEAREEDSYLGYRKGVLVLWAVRDLLGEETLHGALRKLATKRHAGANDLVAALRAIATPDQRARIDAWFTQTGPPRHP